MTSIQQTRRAKNRRYSFVGGFCESFETFANATRGALLQQSSWAINPSQSIQVTTSNHVRLQSIDLHFKDRLQYITLHAADVKGYTICGVGVTLYRELSPGFDGVVCVICQAAVYPTILFGQVKDL